MPFYAPIASKASILQRKVRHQNRHVSHAQMAKAHQRDQTLRLIVMIARLASMKEEFKANNRTYVFPVIRGPIQTLLVEQHVNIAILTQTLLLVQRV